MDARNVDGTMRYKNPAVTSNYDERAILEQILIKKDISLYQLALECNVSESTLYKYRQGWKIAPETKRKIDCVLNNIDFELFEEEK